MACYVHSQDDKGQDRFDLKSCPRQGRDNKGTG